MSRLARYTQKLFGSTAGANQIAKFGSFAASAPVRYSGATATPTNIQALSQFLDGWVAAQVGSGNPAVEDMNALCYLFAYQLGYIMQSGVPEWDASTTYYTGQIVSDGAAILYYSLVDTNLNHVVTDGTKWGLYADLIGAQMTSVGADDVANTRTRPTGTSVVAGGIVLTSSCGTFNTSSATYVDITNLSGTIVTSGRPVLIQCIPDGSQGQFYSSGSNASAIVGLDRGGSDTGLSVWASTGASGSPPVLPITTVSFMDFQVAGTYTYKLRLKQTGSAQANFNAAKMTIREL